MATTSDTGYETMDDLDDVPIDAMRRIIVADWPMAPLLENYLHEYHPHVFDDTET